MQENSISPSLVFRGAPFMWGSFAPSTVWTSEMYDAWYRQSSTEAWNMRNVRLETLLLAVWIVSPNLPNNYSTQKRAEASCFIIHTKKLQTQSQTWICDSKIWPFVESGDTNIDVYGVFQSSSCDDVKLFFISKVVFSVCGSWMQLQKVVSHWWSRISVILFWFNCAGFVFPVHLRAFCLQ